MPELEAAIQGRRRRPPQGGVLPLALIALIAVVTLAGCVTTPDPHPADTMRGERFVDGPEFRRASAYEAEAIEQHRLAFIETEEEERDALLEAALDLCEEAQGQYQRAMSHYPYHQREMIDFQRAALLELMMEIQRDQR